MLQKLTRKILILSTHILWGSSVLAQTPFAWSKTYGGSGSDKGYCIRQTSDGGLIVSG